MARLLVVATPIGNLEDLSPRAARALKESPVVAAESLRRARGLLSHLGLAGKRLISCREANRARAAGQVLAALSEGRDVALISDAGTPGVSDPASAVVAAALEAGYAVSPLPGPSALAAALCLAPFPVTPLAFLGFLPAKVGPRRRLLASARDTGWALALFEAPHRLAATARDLGEVLGGRRLLLARELSKLHEQVLLTSCQELAGSLGPEGARGEITLVVAGGEPAAPAEEQLDELLRQGLAAGGLAPSRLAKQVARQTGVGREQVYRRLLEIKGEA